MAAHVAGSFQELPAAETVGALDCVGQTEGSKAAIEDRAISTSAMSHRDPGWRHCLVAIDYDSR